MKKIIPLFSFTLVVSFLLSCLPGNTYATGVKIVSVKNLNVTVNLNQRYSLPQTVDAVMSDKTTQKIAVTWSPKAASTAKVGTFLFKGTIRGYANQLLLTLKVAAPAKPVTSGSYTDPELARAVSLGIGTYAANQNVTYVQFFKMLDAAVMLADPTKAKAWKLRFPKARGANKTITRSNAMMAVYFAAETLGEGYCAYNNGMWDVLNDKIGNRWDKYIVDCELFPECKKPTIVGEKWDYRETGAYFYSFARVSPVSDKSIFEYDPKSNSMRTEQPLKYEEALLAALRLHDTGLAQVERTLTNDDKEILTRADTRRAAVLKSETNVKISGTSYYISNQGNDNNDGLSPQTPWATLNKINRASFKNGDGVFFERGGLWRGTIRCADGVTYSAYGSGEKPRIYASPENGADPSKWKLLEGTSNIWVYYKYMPDCGSLVFNDGESWADKTVPFWNGKEYVNFVNWEGTVMKADVKKLENLHFQSRIDLTGEALPVYMWEKSHLIGPLYLRCDAGNPGNVYKSIEFSIVTFELAVVDVGDGCLIDNLCVKYGANNGIGFGKNSTIQNCEVAWVGGMTHRYAYERGIPFVVGAGDGINTSNYGNSAINNYIHHCYDNGIIIGEAGFLGWFDPDEEKHLGNLVAKGNLVEYCNGGMTLTIWEPYDGKHKYKNTLIEDNYVLYSGYGWSYDLHLKMNGSGARVTASSLLFQAYAANEDTLVKNNIFYIAKGAIIQHPMEKKYFANYSGNTYAQNNWGWLDFWEPDYPKWHFFNLYAQKYIRDIIGDKTGRVLPVQPDK